jgi:hypothetical protein
MREYEYRIVYGPVAGLPSQDQLDQLVGPEWDILTAGFPNGQLVLLLYQPRRDDHANDVSRMGPNPHKG